MSAPACRKVSAAVRSAWTTTPCGRGDPLRISAFMVLLAFFRLRSLLSFGDFQFVRRLLPFVHLVVVFGFQLVVSLVVGFVVLGRFGEFAVVIRDLLLQIGQRRFDRFDRLAELAQEFSCSFFCS